MILILLYFAGAFHTLQAVEETAEKYYSYEHTEFFPEGGMAVKKYYYEANTDHNVMGTAPSSLDWRKKGLVTKVKNQGSCEAGWSFAMIGAVEGQYAKTYGELLDFSTQELLDCLVNCGGCGYCDPTLVLTNLHYIGGIEEEVDYQYVGEVQRCHYERELSKIKMKGLKLHFVKDETPLMAVLADEGPLYMSIDGTAFNEYKKGIMEDCPFKNVTHAVLLVGYGSENGVDYWIVKNSKGELWGEKGYARIRRNIDACGLTQSPVIKPIIEK